MVERGPHPEEAHGAGNGDRSNGRQLRGAGVWHTSSSSSRGSADVMSYIDDLVEPSAASREGPVTL